MPINHSGINTGTTDVPQSVTDSDFSPTQPADTIFQTINTGISAAGFSPKSNANTHVTRGIMTSAAKQRTNVRSQAQIKDDIEYIYRLFSEYRDAYTAEWARLEKCERLYYGKHWDEVPFQDANEPRPYTPVIQSTIENVRSELIEWYPAAVVMADDPKYNKTAELLSSVIEENHIACNYEGEYDKMLFDLLTGGYMVQEVGFDPELSFGLGGAYIRCVDNRCIMFDPNCNDVQSCRAIFKYAAHPMSWYFEHYPKQAMKMDTDELSVITNTDDTIMQTNDGAVLLIECWRREFDPERNKYCVHMTKVAGRTLIEDSRDYFENGVFAHGKYPFIVTPLFRRKGCVLGYGFADVFEKQQMLSDKLDQIIMKNALMASHNKLLVTSASGFDIEELRDWSKEVHHGENLNGVKWFSTAPLPSYIISYVQAMRESIKEETGANDFSRGQTMGGVTAASAISLLQDMSNKRARMVARTIHHAFAEAVRMEIEIEREYSKFARPVIVERGKERVLFDNTMLLDGKYPIEFSVDVKVHKENRFTVLSNNETIMKLIQSGVITPQVGLDALIFDGKEEVVAKMQPIFLQAQQEKQAQKQTQARIGGENT